jgi:hypothetical protein
VFPRSVILIAQELINFLCAVLNFLTKMYVQSMYMKCITNLILDLALDAMRVECIPLALLFFLAYNSYAAIL